MDDRQAGTEQPAQVPRSREGVLPLESWQVRGYYVADAVAEFERLKQTTKIQGLIDQAEKLERTAAKSTEIGLGVKIRAEANGLRSQAERLKKDLPVLRKVERTTEN